LNVYPAIKSLLCKYISSVIEAPPVCSSKIIKPGLINDDVFWAILLPLSGRLEIYPNKEEYVKKFPPYYVLEIKDFAEVKKVLPKATVAGTRFRYDFYIKMSFGTHH
jgi:hypothetical protein